MFKEISMYIVFPGDYVLHEGQIHRVIDTDGDMQIKLANGKWIEASEKDIDGLRSEPEMVEFVSLELA